MHRGWWLLLINCMHGTVCLFTSTSLSFSSGVLLQPSCIGNKQADMCTLDHCSAASNGLERSCVCSVLWLTMWVVWWYGRGSLPHVVELNGKYLWAIGCCDNSWRRPTWPKCSVYWLLLLLRQLLSNTPRFSGWFGRIFEYSVYSNVSQNLYMSSPIWIFVYHMMMSCIKGSHTAGNKLTTWQ